MSDLRAIELSLAYDNAGSIIESSCRFAEMEIADEGGWFDLASSEIDLSDEIAYLDSRRLLLYHPEHPQWVKVCDEDEPLADPALQAPTDVTERGFGVFARITDTNGNSLRVQESSSLQPCVWLFLDGQGLAGDTPAAHLSLAQAALLVGSLNAYLGSIATRLGEKAGA